MGVMPEVQTLLCIACIGRLLGMIRKVYSMSGVPGQTGKTKDPMAGFSGFPPLPR